jgi:hypothetical protein
MLRMIVRLPAPSQRGAMPSRSTVIATALLHLHPTTALRGRHNRLAALLLVLMDDQTGPHTVAATPLSVVELAKFPDPQYSTASGSPNTATLWGRGR